MKSKKLGEIRFPYLDGFTLLELLIVISIAGILLSITIPSYSNLVSQKRVEAAANSFHSAVALAGSESRKRGKNVNIRPIGWAGNNALTLAEGWEVYYQESGTQIVMRQERPSGNLLVGGTGSKGFYLAGKTGRLGSGAEKIACFSASNGDDITNYSVIVNQSGVANKSTSSSC
ncbi:MAG: prepilin-type N-terminal cleavage/methylation domain-containing protein [SAR92 clade bacterium]|uniref:Type II secretion system protein H n=1 Tax=SAR92 clade bacterium TaxID=2315479 RepID=A0A520MB83_9GAMM|nr:MAG: prepilin-type N-terminal cleavage/methylation domain-containing protein [SAR92 clade bacterium]